MSLIGIIVVEICESNLLQTINTENLLESEYPEVSVLVSECLNFCGLCRFAPFAFVNGKRIRGKDVDDCIQKIRQAIEVELALFQ